MAAKKKKAGGLTAWVAVQVKEFAYLLFIICGGGILLTMIGGRFKWPAFIAALFTMWVLLGSTVMAVFAQPGPLQGPKEDLLWGGCLISMAIAGALAGFVGKRVGVFESQLAWFITLALIWVHLLHGWHVLLNIGANETEAYLDFMTRRSPGEDLFGAMWDRVVGLAAFGSLLMTIMGGSFAFLVFGEERRFDPRFRFEWLVARRHLAGRGGLVSVTAIVAVIGVALGVGALVAVTAVMSGYQQDVQDKILSTNAHLVIQKYGIDFVEYDRVAEDARRVPGVLASTAFSFNEAMLSDGDLGMGVLLKGVVPDSAGQVTSVAHNLCREISQEDPSCPRRWGKSGDAQILGSMLQPRNGQPSVVIGSGLFRKLKLPIGGEISLTTPIGVAGARGNAPRRMVFRIGGVFRSGMHEFDTRLIYMHLTAAQHFMGLGSAVNGVEFKVADPENVEVLGERVLTAVGRYPYRKLDWRELNAGIFTALKLQKIVMFLVLCSIIIVGAFNIASTLFMAVVEKSREIGVLKSMGARNSSIMKIFVIEGWLVGTVGTILGIIIGLFVCALLSRLDIGIAADVYMVDSLQVRVNPSEVIGTAIAALAVSHLATIYPALKAAGQAPVNAMRYE